MYQVHPRNGQFLTQVFWTLSACSSLYEYISPSAISSIFLESCSICFAAFLPCSTAKAGFSRKRDSRIINSWSSLLTSSTLVVADRKTGKFYKKVRERKPYKCCRDIEYTVCDRDRCRCCHLCHKRKMHSCVDHIEQYHEYATVPIRLKYRWIIAARFAFLFAPIADKKCCHTGTDILSHDDRKCRTDTEPLLSYKVPAGYLPMQKMTE